MASSSMYANSPSLYPTVAIKAPCFDGNNFNLWKVRFKCHLQSLGVEAYNSLIRKYIAPNKNKKKFSSVEQQLYASNEHVLKLLHSSIGTNLSNKFSHCKSAFELMSCLEKLHEVKELQVEEHIVVDHGILEPCHDSTDTSSSSSDCKSSSSLDSCSEKSFDYDQTNDMHVDDSTLASSYHDLLSLSNNMCKKLKLCSKRIKFLELENIRLTNENEQLSSSYNSHLIKIKNLFVEKERLVASVNLQQVQIKSLVDDFMRSSDLCEDLISRNKSLLLSHSVLFDKIKLLKNNFCVEKSSTSTSSLSSAHSHSSSDCLHHHHSTPKSSHGYAHSHVSRSTMHTHSPNAYMYHTHKDISCRPVYVCAFCGRHGHIAHFCYDRLRSTMPIKNNDHFSATNTHGPKVRWVPKIFSSLSVVGCSKGGAT